jgi:hypothetical protein
MTVNEANFVRGLGSKRSATSVQAFVPGPRSSVARNTRFGPGCDVVVRRSVLSNSKDWIA